VVVKADRGKSRVVGRLTQSVNADSGTPVVAEVIDRFTPPREPGLWVGQNDVQPASSASLPGVDHKDRYADVRRVPDGPPPRRRYFVAAERQARSNWRNKHVAYVLA